MASSSSAGFIVNQGNLTDVQFNFNNSPFNIPGNPQAVRRKVIKRRKPEVPSNLSDADRERKKKEFTRSVCAHSSRLAGQKSDTIIKAKLSDPDFEVNPVLKEVDFYAGKIENYQQYRKEDFFDTSVNRSFEGQMLDLESLENSLYDKKNRHISLAGSAGSGKSTIIKRLVRNIRRKDEFELVYFVTISSISDCDEVSLLELLFDNPSLHDCRDLGYEWLMNNQQKAIFIFDGLDQSMWPFLQNSSSMGYYDASDTATVMYNLLSGKLFPDLTIVTTSREHVLTHFQDDMRPQRVIQLAGLVLDDRKRLFQALVGDVDGQMWTNMESHSPSIVHFSAIPLICVYNAIAHKLDPNNIPQTMSALLGKILQHFIHLGHAIKGAENIKIWNKLKHLSYEMTKDKKVIFTENDLKKSELEKSQVSALIIQVPDYESLNTHLIEGETKLFFTHQCIQEILAALYICEMDMEDFSTEVEKRLHDDHWSVVRRFVCGYLLNQETRNAFSKLAKHQTDSDELQNKQENLKKSLVGQLQRREVHKKLELFASLSECENLEFVRSHIKDIQFRFQVIGANGMHALSSVLIGCKQVRKLKLFNCHLTAEHLGILSRNLKSADVKIKNLEISVNQLGNAGGLLGEIVKENGVDELGMYKCGITAGTLRRFQESSRGSKIRELDVSSNQLDDAGGLLGEIVKENGVDELGMSECGITAETLRRFHESSRGSKIRKLDISGNELDDAGGLLGEIVKENGVDELDIGKCGITAETLRRFHESSRGSKIRKLIVSSNQLVDAGGLLGEIVKENEVDEVVMRGCGITAGTLRRFQESSKGSKLRRLNLSQNPLNDDDRFHLLIELLEQGTVEELVAWGCDLTAERRSTLKETAARHGARVHFT